MRNFDLGDIIHIEWVDLKGSMIVVIAIILIVAGCLLAIVRLINCLSNPDFLKPINKPMPKAKPTQAERDAYYLQQFGMTEVDYMATVDMYANWPD